ncbi:hypothetical protein G5I_02094 [Acromyrmex echinatior]|uniref:Uncharacterized protein n=1 Tax=Acromyrmex echinatior TaxID=103372 RepID=F4W9E3_ACREC|nr:hypothetical protein G5I_02094 [Acromyrmex echinatior]
MTWSTLLFVAIRRRIADAVNDASDVDDAVFDIVPVRICAGDLISRGGSVNQGVLLPVQKHDLDGIPSSRGELIYDVGQSVTSPSSPPSCSPWTGKPHGFQGSLASDYAVASPWVAPLKESHGRATEAISLSDPNCRSNQCIRRGGSHVP